MIQVEVTVTEEQMHALEELAKQQRATVSELISRGIDTLLGSTSSSDREALAERALQAAGRFRSGRRDLSERHDEYLAEALAE